MEATEKWPRFRRRLYLVRHGDVSYFGDDGRPFRPTGVGLNEAGRRQARLLGDALRDVPLDRAVTSDLPRCLETADIILAGRPVPRTARAELREIQPGRLADIPPGQVADAFLGAFGRGVGRESRFLGGETYGSLVDRVLPSFLEVLRDPGGANVLIVAHGGVNRVILAHALGLEPCGFLAAEQDPGCLNIIDVADDGDCLVRLLNFTPGSPLKADINLTTMESLYRQFTGRGREIGP
jgi:probable phosphoglycerate mutase